MRKVFAVHSSGRLAIGLGNNNYDALNAATVSVERSGVSEADISEAVERLWALDELNHAGVLPEDRKGFVPTEQWAIHLL